MGVLARRAGHVDTRRVWAPWTRRKTDMCLSRTALLVWRQVVVLARRSRELGSMMKKHAEWSAAAEARHAAALQDARVSAASSAPDVAVVDVDPNGEGAVMEQRGKTAREHAKHALVVAVQSLLPNGRRWECTAILFQVWCWASNTREYRDVAVCPVHELELRLAPP